MSQPKPTTRDIEYTETEYGVELEDNFVAICGDEEEARLTKAMCADAKVVTREVYFTAWAVS